MGSDYYKVDVVHYINPHLIWVITRKQDDESLFHFEQIGLYGVLPQNVTIDVDCVLKTEVSEEWLPAAVVAMTKSFHDAAEIWFSPTYIDKKSSIFDDNTHKFGDICVVKKDGKSITLMDEVVQSGFAYTDENLFHQQLVQNNLPIKLGYVAEHDVLKKLKEGFLPRRVPENLWLYILRQQTSVFEEKQQLEESIKNRKVPIQDRDKLDTIFKSKMNDFNLCKDVDEVSAGRANSIRRNRSTVEITDVKTVNWKNKFEWLEQKAKEKRRQNSGSECNKSFTSGDTDRSSENKKQNGLTRFRNDNNRFTNKTENNRDNRSENNSDTKRNSYNNSDNQNSDLNNQNYCNDSHENNDQNNKINIRNHQNNHRNYQNNHRNYQNKYRNNQNNDRNNRNDDRNNRNDDRDKNDDQDYRNNDENHQNLNKLVKKPQKSAGQEVRNIAYGPAGLAHTKFRIKPYAEDEEERKKTKQLQETQKKMCENTTPEVKSNISNSDTSMQYQLTQNSVQTDTQINTTRKNGAFEFLKRKRQFLEQQKRVSNVVSPSDNESDNGMAALDEELRKKYEKHDKKPEENIEILGEPERKPNVNPYRNLDGSISVFVDKLTTPILMVHTKKGNRVQPISNMRDIPFGNNIHCALRDMQITRPMRTQTISWMSILRGHSFFVVSPHKSGNTMGYLPAVCRLASDFKETYDKCELRSIIVCATSRSLHHVQNVCKILAHNVKVLACHAGMSDLSITTSLLNGCDILVCTPSMLVRLIQKDFCLDLHNISTFVVDDCEYISKFYVKEIKYCIMKVLEIVKKRPNKEWKCQFIAVSRIWCDVLSSLAKKAPDSIVCISAFEECVLYSKAATTVEFLAEEKKLGSVIKFLQDIDKSKKTVIVCKSDHEVKLISEALINLKHVVFSCDSRMTVEDLYALDKALKEYEEPLLGPILVCCDGNLSHLNVTDAHYLIQYSLPNLFSMFSRRFAVLNDNYSSIFNDTDSNVKIKILLDDSNIEALPKILQFVKRCMRDVPPHLDEITSEVVREKNLVLAKSLVPVCKMLLTLGECSNYWDCHDRHAFFKEYDEPKEWLPKDGVINFKVIHYHSAAHYSTRLLSYVSNDKTTKTFPQNYSLLSLKMGLYYSKESNKRLQGILKPGDICAVTLKQNLFVRCQVIKIFNFKGNNVLIKLIDEEKYKYVSDTSIYYLPDELKKIETHVVNVALANIRPEDKDVTYSDLAEKHVKQFIEENDEVFVRGQIAMVTGNTVLVESLEVCQELSSLEEIVVKHNLRKELLDGHAVSYPEHINNLKKMCDFVVTSDANNKQTIKDPIPSAISKTLPKCRWAHLENGVFSSVMFMAAENPTQFFVRLAKFDKCLTTLINDIKLYVAENPEPKKHINDGDIVIAEHPDDSTFERARVEGSIINGKVRCFFVDQAEWREVSVKKILPITEKFITQLPFQVIECRLIGVKPFGESWSDFATNFFTDSCFNGIDQHKMLYTKYFKKEKATVTDGHKYGIVLIDTYSEEDIIINQILIEKNLAKENDEIELLDNIGFEKEEEATYDSDDEFEPKSVVSTIDNAIFSKNPDQQPSSNNVLRYVPVMDSEEDEDDDEYDLVSADPKTPFPVPLSEIVSIKELPDAEWTEEDAASPLTCYVPGENNEQDTNTEDVDSKTDNEDTQNNTTDLENSEVDTKSIVEEVKDNTVDEKVNAEVVKPKTDVEKKTNEIICKPKLLWSQTRTVVTLKIQLIVDKYDMTIKERSINMSATVNDTAYGFDIELYGVVNVNRCSHANKGQYILVKLWKVMASKWLSLTKDPEVKKWIAYDMDTIEVSSDEEFEVVDNLRNILQHREAESESDDSLLDDTNFRYKGY
ncbi:unnamed protein product [Spodoptera exigua]|nr:unnamed protein product [Spodoptera exigua]